MKEDKYIITIKLIDVINEFFDMMNMKKDEMKVYKIECGDIIIECEGKYFILNEEYIKKNSANFIKELREQKLKDLGL